MGVPLDPKDIKPQPAPGSGQPSSPTYAPQAPVRNYRQEDKDEIQKLIGEEKSKRAVAADPKTDPLTRETMLRDASNVHAKRKAEARAYETAMGFPSIYDKRNGK